MEAVQKNHEEIIKFVQPNFQQQAYELCGNYVP